MVGRRLRHHHFQSCCQILFMVEGELGSRFYLSTFSGVVLSSQGEGKWWKIVASNQPGQCLKRETLYPSWGEGLGAGSLLGSVLWINTCEENRAGQREALDPILAAFMQDHLKWSQSPGAGMAPLSWAPIRQEAGSPHPTSPYIQG